MSWTDSSPRPSATSRLNGPLQVSRRGAQSPAPPQALEKALAGEGLLATWSPRSARIVCRCDLFLPLELPATCLVPGLWRVDWSGRRDARRAPCSLHGERHPDRHLHWCRAPVTVRRTEPPPPECAHGLPSSTRASVRRPARFTGSACRPGRCVRSSARSGACRRSATLSTTWCGAWAPDPDDHHDPLDGIGERDERFGRTSASPKPPRSGRGRL